MFYPGTFETTVETEENLAAHQLELLWLARNFFVDTRYGGRVALRVDRDAADLVTVGEALAVAFGGFPRLRDRDRVRRVLAAADRHRLRAAATRAPGSGFLLSTRDGLRRLLAGRPFDPARLEFEPRVGGGDLDARQAGWVSRITRALRDVLAAAEAGNSRLIFRICDAFENAPITVWVRPNHMEQILREEIRALEPARRALRDATRDPRARR